MDSRYNVKWNNFHSALEMGFYELLENEKMVDVTLIAEGGYLKAHKIILSISSLYFQELFEAHPCQHPFIVLKDVQYQELANMVDFMYKGEVDVQQENLASFLKLAETLKVKNFFIGEKQDNNLEILPSTSQHNKSLSSPVGVKIETQEIDLDDSNAEELDDSLVDEERQTKKERSSSIRATRQSIRFIKNPRVHLVRLPEQGLDDYLKNDNKFLQDRPRNNSGLMDFNNAGLSRDQSTKGAIKHQKKKPSVFSRHSSPIWEFFHKTNQHSVCKKCGQKYKGGKHLSNFKRHLEVKHPYLFKIFLNRTMKQVESKGHQKSYSNFQNFKN